MLVLPTSFGGDARYTFDCDLDNVTYQFEMEWNDRDSGWYMSISNSDGEPLVTGRRVVLNYPLTNIYRDPRLPAGSLVAIDSSGTDTEPGLLDLGDRVKLVYVPVAEL